MTILRFRPLLGRLTALILALILLAGCSVQMGDDGRDAAMDTIATQGKLVDFAAGYDQTVGQVLGQVPAAWGEYDLYLVGEGHGSQTNYLLQLYLTRYFVEEQSVRYLLLEESYSVGQLLNRYLETGAEALLSEIFSGLQGTISCNQDNLELYRSLYAYRQSLPEEKRFQFVGIQLESPKPLTFRYLSLLLEEAAAGTDSGGWPAPLRQLKEANRYNFNDRTLISTLKEELESREADYRDALGEGFFPLSMVVQNLYHDTSDYSSQEKAIAANFRLLYENLPEGKYFGQLGLIHAAKKKIQLGGDSAPVIDSFAQDINDNFAPVQGRVLSLPILYNNCSYLDRTQKEKSLATLGVESLKGEEPSAYFLQREQCGQLFDYLLAMGMEEGDLGDGLFLISNSPAARPLS